MSIDTDKLQFVSRPKFLRERPVMVINDCPLALEAKSGLNYSSQGASQLFQELHKVGIRRNDVHATSLLSFRPPEGDLSHIFFNKAEIPSEYTDWFPAKNTKILKYAHRELEVLREEIKRVNPRLILCTGKYALYFLAGVVNRTEAKKSEFGALLKWRASHLTLDNWWGYQDHAHIIMPILHPSAKWKLKDKLGVMTQDFKRVGIVGAEAKLAHTSGDDTQFIPYIARKENYITKPTFSQVEIHLHMLIDLADESPEGLKLGIDVETRMKHQDCIGIAHSISEAICIPFTTMNNEFYWTEIELLKIILLLQELFYHPNVKHIGQNYAYDMQYLLRDFGLNVAPFQDTMVMQHTIFPELEKSLDFLASLYCRVYRYWKGAGKEGSYKTDDIRWVYNCRDCCITLEVSNVLEHMYTQVAPKVQQAYHFQQYELLPAIVRVMNRGVRVNRKRKAELYAETTALMDTLQTEINTIIGEPLNIGSYKQLRNLFYNLLGFPVQLDPKTKQPTTNAAALEVLKGQKPYLAGLIDRILEFRSLAVFSGTFLAAETDIDNRMRTSYNICGTGTFRLSSRQNAFGSGMNLQNVPIGGTTTMGHQLPNIKDLFICDEGKTFFDIDLDSADLRIVVAISGASDLQQMLNEGHKPYVELMKEYYNDPTKSKHSKEYKTFKAFAHGTHYKGSASGLAVRLGLTVHEVATLQRWYLQRNPEIAAWHKRLEAQVMKRGWIENVFGYRTYFFNKSIPTLMNIAAAWEPQSTVGILINKGLVNIDKYEPEIDVSLQVHDSLAGQFNTVDTDASSRIIQRCTMPLPYEVPITIPVDIHTSTAGWGGCK